jgi:quercetin dioxygenase-like cupin family protein
MTRIIHADDRPWLQIDPATENFFKIISVDEAMKQVVMIVKFAPNAIYPKHLHNSMAVAYTLEGEWEYEEGVLPVGSFAIEPPGTVHTPTVSSKGVTILAVLTATTDNFVEVPMEDGSTFVQDLAYWKALHAMTAEEARASHAVGVTMSSRETEPA